MASRMKLSKVLVAATAGVLTVSGGLLTAGGAVAAVDDACSVGSHAVIDSGQSGAFAVVPLPWNGDPTIGALVQMAGTAAYQGAYEARMSAFEGNGEGPGARVSSSSSTHDGERTVTTSPTTVNGVTAAGMTLTAATTDTMARASVTIDRLTTPAGAGYYADPVASRVKLNADGAALASSITAALPGVVVALAGDASPASAAFVASLQAAAAAGPAAGDQVMTSPALEAADLTQEFTSSDTGGSGANTVGTLTVGGVIAAKGFAGSAAVDLVGGQTTNARTTMTSPALTLVGLPLTVDEGSGWPSGVDVSTLPASARSAVTAELAASIDAVNQLWSDAGITITASNGFDAASWTGSQISAPYYTAIIGDLPTSSEGQFGTYLASFAGAQLSSTCYADAAVPVPTTTPPVPDPTTTTPPVPDPTTTTPPVPDPTTTTPPVTDPTTTTPPVPTPVTDPPVTHAPIPVQHRTTPKRLAG